MGKQIQKFTEWWNQKNEGAALLVIAIACICIFVPGVDPTWPEATMVAFACLLFLEADFFEGVSWGPAGISVNKDCDSER